jgi:hypothetical protein
MLTYLDGLEWCGYCSLSLLGIYCSPQTPYNLLVRLLREVLLDFVIGERYPVHQQLNFVKLASVLKMVCHFVAPFEASNQITAP